MTLSEIWAEVTRVLSFQLFSIGDQPVNVATVVIALMIIAASYLTSRAIRRAAGSALRRRGGDEGSIQAIGRLIHYVILFIGFGIALRTIGINLQALFAAGAVFAIGLGFAMQNIAQNFVAGIILLSERAIKPGDILDLENRIVQVKKLGIRATQVQSRDGEDIIVPNSTIVQSSVVNYTLRDSEFRLWVDVGVVYGSDMKLVFDTLRAAADGFDQRATDRDVAVFMTGYGDSSVDFRVGVWSRDPWEQRQIKSSLLDAVWWALKEQGITIAFPQLDVHLDEPVERALAA